MITSWVLRVTCNSFQNQIQDFTSLDVTDPFLINQYLSGKSLIFCTSVTVSVRVLYLSPIWLNLGPDVDNRIKWVFQDKFQDKFCIFLSIKDDWNSRKAGSRAKSQGVQNFQGSCIWRTQAAVILQQPAAGENFWWFYDLIEKISTFGA